MVTGVFFIVAAAAAIAGLILYGPVLDNPDYIIDPAASDTSVLWGAVLEVFVAISVAGTAIALFPVIRRQVEGVALGYVCGRLLEATVIVVGMISLLSIVTLRQEAGDIHDPASTPSLLTAGSLLVAVHDWTFLVGPNLMFGLNTLMLAYLMHTSRLVPRPIALLGLVGGPLAFGSGLLILFDLYEQISGWGALFTLPGFAWEMSLAVWLIAKGFNHSAVRRLTAVPVG